MNTEQRWFKCNQIVCKCGYHTTWYAVDYSHGWGAFNEYLDHIGARSYFWSGPYDEYRERNKCPLCGEKYDGNIKTVCGWNKVATENQIAYLSSLGITHPETLLHESVNYILQNRERKAEV